MPVEERGVADGTDEHAPTFVSDACAKLGALVSFRAKEAQLYEFLGTQEFLQLPEEFRRETRLPNLEVVGQRLAETTKVGFLGAGERELVHERTVSGTRRRRQRISGGGPIKDRGALKAGPAGGRRPFQVAGPKVSTGSDLQARGESPAKSRGPKDSRCSVSTVAPAAANIRRTW